MCKVGEAGLLQLLSDIPESYPGFSILTDDIGVLMGDNDCKCGALGRYFSFVED